MPFLHVNGGVMDASAKVLGIVEHSRPEGMDTTIHIVNVNACGVLFV
jgi:hypothetical protein